MLPDEESGDLKGLRNWQKYLEYMRAMDNDTPRTIPSWSYSAVKGLADGDRNGA